MKSLLKVVSVIVILTTVCLTTSAQSFFSRMPRGAEQSGFTPHSSVFGTTQWAFRPIVSITSYSVPGNQLSTGAGVAYELLSQDPDTKLWSSVVSLSTLVNYNLPLTPESKPGSPIGVSAFLGVFDNHILVGGMYDGKKLNFEIGTAINFNN